MTGRETAGLSFRLTVPSVARWVLLFSAGALGLRADLRGAGIRGALRGTASAFSVRTLFFSARSRSMETSSLRSCANPFCTAFRKASAGDPAS